ncbi:hypothetical protein [Corynebacterium sp. HMSC04H06]|nr:hypothetical protein [Corynebacterium sp. HMSC04H06]
MAQEQFAGPEYHTEFDPEKFLRDLRAQAAEEEDETTPDDGASRS